MEYGRVPHVQVSLLLNPKSKNTNMIPSFVLTGNLTFISTPPTFPGLMSWWVTPRWWSCCKPRAHEVRKYIKNCNATLGNFRLSCNSIQPTVLLPRNHSFSEIGTRSITIPQVLVYGFGSRSFNFPNKFPLEVTCDSYSL